jgi:hypothetical protein
MSKGATMQREQTMKALNRATSIRLARAAVKRRVRAKSATLAEVLELDCVQSARIYDVVCWLPRVGESTATQRLSQLGINPYRAVSGLTERQRGILVAAFGAREAVAA